MFVNCSMFVLSAIPSPNPLLLSMKVLYYFSPVCWVVPARSTLSLASLRMLSVERSSSCPAMTVTMFMTFWIALVESALCASCFTKSVLSCYANVVSAAIQYFQFFSSPPRDMLQARVAVLLEDKFRGFRPRCEVQIVYDRVHLTS